MATHRVTRREMLGLLAMGAAGLAAAGCANPTATPVPPTKVPVAAPTGTLVPPTKPPSPSGTLTVGIPAGPDTLDPYFWVTFREQDMVTTIFDPPIYREPAGPFVPHLAESWQLINPTTWRLKLRRGVTFHNGRPFNAEAVKFSFERSIDPDLKATLYSPKVIKLKAGVVVDEYTIDMITEGPVAETALHQRLSDFAMLEPSYYKGLSPEDASKKPLGTGPFKLVEWMKDDHMTLEAWPDYWRTDHHWGGPPRFKTLIYKIIPDATARIAALERGLVDIIFDLPLDQAKRLQGDIRPILGTSDARLFIGFNQAKPYLKDKRVRQALNYAVNWEPINQALYYGKAPRIGSWVAPQSSNHNGSLKPYPYDPEKAKALLKEAGVPTGHRLKLTASTSPAERALAAQAVAADLAKVGLTVDVEVVEGSILGKRLTSKEVDDLWLIAYGGGADDGQGALTTLQKDFVLSAYAWDNPEWEHLFADLSGAAAADAEKRRSTMMKLQEIAVEDPPVIYLAIEPKGYAVGKRVKAWEPRFDTLFMPWEVTLA